MQMFAAAGLRDGMKNSGGMRDLKSVFWTLCTAPQMIPDRRWYQTGNDPQTGPQMIPNRKCSPMWTASDRRHRKTRNGIEFA